MIQTDYQSGSLVQTTVSIGSLFEQSTDSSGAIRYQHFIRAGSQTIAIHTRTSDYTQETTYLHRDHLGSISAITNEDGDVIASMSFDAWGQRRDASDWQGSAANPAPATTERGYTGTERGYTGHKMLDGVGLIHMNGRVYDPGIGRFMSADPIIQAPYNSQSYNRYSYVWNNPLSAVDPSGFVRDIPGVYSRDLTMQALTGSYCAYGKGGCTENMDRLRQGQPFLPRGGSVVMAEVLRYGLNAGQYNSLSENSRQRYLDTVVKLSGITKINPVTAYAALDPRVLANQRGAITDYQLRLAINGNYIEFWRSRFSDSGDPVARIALIGWGDPGYVGASLFEQLAASYTWSTLEGYISSNGLNVTMEQLGAELALSHAYAVMGDSSGIHNLLSPQQVADYHHVVFANHNIPAYIFGGTHFIPGVSVPSSGGWVPAMFNADSYSGLWCSGCDVAP